MTVARESRQGPHHWEGEPIAVWESLWRIPYLEARGTISSTNDRLRELGEAGAPPFSVVTAEGQTEGRGRNGRRWHSPAGMGLWMSVLIRLPGPNAAPLTPIVMGLCSIRAIGMVAARPALGIKWPNDILTLGGGKIGGILCEALPNGLVIAGVGINIRQRPEDFPPELRNEASSLEAEGSGRISRSRLAGALVGEIRDRLSSPPTALTGTLAEEIAALDLLRDRRVSVSTGVGGIARGIHESGALLVEDDGGRERRVVAGTVRASRAADPGPGRRT